MNKVLSSQQLQIWLALSMAACPSHLQRWWVAEKWHRVWRHHTTCRLIICHTSLFFLLELAVSSVQLYMERNPPTLDIFSSFWSRNSLCLPHWVCLTVFVTDKKWGKLELLTCPFSSRWLFCLEEFLRSVSRKIHSLYQGEGVNVKCLRSFTDQSPRNPYQQWTTVYPTEMERLVGKGGLSFPIPLQLLQPATVHFHWLTGLLSWCICLPLPPALTAPQSECPMRLWLN